MKKNGSTPTGTTINDNDIIQNLVKACQGTTYSKWLKVVWENPGILTNQLSAYGLQSNNHHNASQELNLRIEPLGWKIVKQIKTRPNESWAWFIVPVEQSGNTQLALNLANEEAV